MTSQEIQSLKNLTASELFVRAKEDVAKETQSTLRVLHILREIERRRAFAEKSYPSLFEFCVDFLGYKRGAAYRRILAMRALKDLPEIEEKIEGGALTLMTVAQAQGYFKDRARKNKPLGIDQKREVIRALENKSVWETDRYFLEVMPQELVKEKLKPLDQNNYQWQMTLPAKVKEKLDRYRALLGKDGNNLENIEILEKALDQAIQLEEKKVPSVGKIKRLWQRDQTQCAFFDPKTNLRCPQRKNLEVDHITPKALGGDSSLENLRLLCKAHNQRAAINVFGLSKMTTYIDGD